MEPFAGTPGMMAGPAANEVDWAHLAGLEGGRPGKIRFSRFLPARAHGQGQTHSDSHPMAGDTVAMNDITREEFNAKLETIEAKMDARVQAVTSKIDGFLASQDERDKRLDLLLAQISKDSGEAKTSISSMKTTLIVTAVSTVLAIVIGVASFNTALTSNMMSAFQLGANHSDQDRQQTSNPPSATKDPLSAPEAKNPTPPPPNTPHNKARQ